jgi:hypothetical protein
MDPVRAFDEAARGVELRLAELRRLLAGLESLTDAQQAQMAALLPSLETVSAATLALRNEVLNAPAAPMGFVERGYESLPAGFAPTEWTTETYVTPVTAAWGQEFQPKPGGDVTVDSLFEESDTPPEVVLPMDADLAGLFLDLTPVYESDPRLLTGRDASGDWCVIIDDRPDSFASVMVFRTEAERGAWLGRVYASTLRPGDEMPSLENQQDSDLDEGDPTSRVPVTPLVPVRPGSAGRTLAEALEEPRNP